jgi:hypothetical protein
LKKIKVGYCIAYDWEMLQYSLPQVYREADEICLALDKGRISWAGNKFHFDEEKFTCFINQIDTENKIKLYSDNFFLRELTPMQNEVRQRNLIAEFMKDGHESWFIQLDADEYFLDFNLFVQDLQKIKSNRNVNVCAPFLILYKQVKDGFLYIKNNSLAKQEMIPVATNNPNYEFGRKNGYFNLITNNTIIHQSWARTAEEIRLKLDNWGHKTDFNVDEYFTIWDMLNDTNYKEMANFHPFKPREWEALDFLKAISIDALIQQYKEEDFFKITKLELVLKNSIWLSRFRKYLLLS